MLLGRAAIQRACNQGKIFINPFDKHQLNPNSYDARLGEWYYSCTSVGVDLVDYSYDPFDEGCVRAYWGSPHKALEGIIYIRPGEMILAHTEEFIGSEHLVLSMRARSSIGRSGIAVCKCAGLGDIGYVSRWTMEISNGLEVPVALRTGMRICQFTFESVVGSPLIYIGKYGKARNIKDWTPEDMLPKMWFDWDYNSNSKTLDFGQKAQL